MRCTGSAVNATSSHGSASAPKRRANTGSGRSVDGRAAPARRRSRPRFSPRRRGSPPRCAFAVLLPKWPSPTPRGAAAARRTAAAGKAAAAAARTAAAEPPSRRSSAGSSQISDVEEEPAEAGRDDQQHDDDDDDPATMSQVEAGRAPAHCRRRSDGPLLPFRRIGGEHRDDVVDAALDAAAEIAGLEARRDRVGDDDLATARRSACPRGRSRPRCGPGARSARPAAARRCSWPSRRASRRGTARWRRARSPGLRAS